MSTFKDNLKRLLAAITIGLLAGCAANFVINSDNTKISTETTPTVRFSIADSSFGADSDSESDAVIDSQEEILE